MNSFAVGQRWASTAETELGLGVVTETDHRRVTILFPSIEEYRTYAIAQAPLNRIQFDKGDHIETREGEQAVVLGVENNRGYLIYLVETTSGDQKILPEVELADQIVLNNAKDRLISGHVSRSAWFYLRALAASGHSQHQQSSVNGLVGAKAQLTPHQYYIAKEVSQRFAPRVMLADEVGLGKTIEAGLILHQQLMTGRAQRALIIVPDALCHQWLVELLRKFNLKFSLMDSDRCAHSEDMNPFLSEQLILIPQSLVSHRGWIKDALACDWDLLIVDEAHHYHWDEESPSHEYQVLEALSAKSTGVLLLTATPEQLGIESHFARLRLLDPHRYTDLNRFKQEEREYSALIQAIDPLLAEKPTLNDTQQSILTSYLGNQTDLLQDYLNEPNDFTREPLLRTLLDRHGTGRILFRNTRQQIKGFPSRQLHTYPLDSQEDEYFTDSLYPETDPENTHLEWIKHDPRVNWLINTLKSLASEKVLIICHHAQTVLELSEHLNTRVGVPVCAFHEHMSLIERDRSAAYFATADEGAQAMLCSEIGSEGRNFQFASHLVLFDLPESADLLEQRIGRLDRIGQLADIQIHVPYFRYAASETLFKWYHEALDVFSAPSTTASTLHQHHHGQLDSFIKGEGKAKDMEQLFTQVSKETAALKTELAAGRDRLLELNSCDPVKSKALIQQIQHIDEMNSIQPFVELAFDCYGYDYEELGSDMYSVRPGTEALTVIPGIDEDGFTYTFSRPQALKREDAQLITWEHPLVTNLMDLLFTGVDGSASVALMNHPDFHNGAVYFEALYRPRAQAPKEYQLQRFLPDCALRILVDDAGCSIGSQLSTESIEAHIAPLKDSVAKDILSSQRQNIEFMYKHIQHHAEKAFKGLIKDSQKSLLTELSDEMKRLIALKEQNPLIRQEEIDYLEAQAKVIHQAMQDASLHLDAVRLIINFHG